MKQKHIIAILLVLLFYKGYQFYTIGHIEHVKKIGFKEWRSCQTDADCTAGISKL